MFMATVMWAREIFYNWDEFVPGDFTQQLDLYRYKAKYYLVQSFGFVPVDFVLDWHKGLFDNFEQVMTDIEDAFSINNLAVALFMSMVTLIFWVVRRQSTVKSPTLD